MTEFIRVTHFYEDDNGDEIELDYLVNIDEILWVKPRKGGGSIIQHRSSVQGYGNMLRIREQLTLIGGRLTWKDLTDSKESGSS